MRHRQHAAHGAAIAPEEQHVDGFGGLAAAESRGHSVPKDRGIKERASLRFRLKGHGLWGRSRRSGSCNGSDLCIWFRSYIWRVAQIGYRAFRCSDWPPGPASLRSRRLAGPLSGTAKSAEIPDSGLMPDMDAVVLHFRVEVRLLFGCSLCGSCSEATCVSAWVSGATAYTWNERRQ